MGDSQQPEWMLRVKEDYFRAGDSFLKSPELPELLEDMDANGVERAILLSRVGATDGRANRFVEAEPERFALGVGGFNLLRPMKAVRASSRSSATTPWPTPSVGPSFWGDGMYPPSDAVYYPLYTKCCELDLPLCVNTGIPGPPIPGEVQNPIHLDRVCVRFPELKLCMIHGADPWWDTAIRLMLKYRNLRLMTSAWSPKRLPESLLHYMRTAGRTGCCSPPTTRCCRWSGASARPRRSTLPPEVLDGWLHANAPGLLLCGGGLARTQKRYCTEPESVAIQHGS